LKPTVLQESEGEHRHERVAVKTLPGSPLEVVEAELLLHLLMENGELAYRNQSANETTVRGQEPKDVEQLSP
jgi:hypothetical protein